MSNPIEPLPSEPGSNPKPELDSDGLPKPPEFPDYNDYEEFHNAPTDPAPPPDEDDRVTMLEIPSEAALVKR